MQLTKHIKQGRLLYVDKNYGNQPEDAISISENDYYQWLSFGNVVQSVMHKRKPWQLTLPHQRILLLPLLFFRPVHITELGLGGGNFARFLPHLHQDIIFTSIECNQNVIDCFSEYFNPDKIKITTVHDRGEQWLLKKQKFAPDDDSLDWLICDIYQSQLIDFKETIALLDVFMASVTPNTCLSINLPDASDLDVNLCLTVLQQLQSQHRLVYFHVPNYLNVVIHVMPEHWPIHNPKKTYKHSYLSKSLYQRALNCWKNLKEIQSEVRLAG